MQIDKQLLDHLDQYHFVNASEVLMAIEEFYYPFDTDNKESASMWELLEYQTIADEYIKLRSYEFDEDAF